MTDPFSGRIRTEAPRVERAGGGCLRAATGLLLLGVSVPLGYVEFGRAHPVDESFIETDLIGPFVLFAGFLAIVAGAAAFVFGIILRARDGPK